MKSLWIDKSPLLTHLPLQETLYADVAVVGGGITGLLTAYLLTKTARNVVLLEAHQVGEGTTSHSTGNLYSMIDKRLHHIQSKFDTDTIKSLVESRTAALNLIESLVNKYRIECNFKRVPWYLFSEDKNNDDTVEDERKAAVEAGLPAITLSRTPLPFTTTSAIKVDNQAQFNPCSFVKAMAAIVKNQGCSVYSNSPVLEIDKKDEVFKVRTPEGEVIAKKVVLATHTPKGIYPVQTSLGPYREYAIAGTLRSGNYPEGIFWSTEPEHHISIRTYSTGNEKFLLVIGEDHKVGQADDHEEYYRKLESYARTKFDFENILYRWSAQNYKPADGLPYIGETSTDGIYMATGFSTDGLVYGALSAMIISDHIDGIDNRWADMYKPARFTPIASAGKFIKENVNVVGEMVKDFFGKSDEGSLNPGEGMVVKQQGEKWAVYKDETGNVFALSAVCPHMKCIVHWNNAEKSWDCPCHGSRFSTTGDVIEGPAFHPLEKKVFDKK